MSPKAAEFLGDLVMVIHFIYIAIVIFGLALILVGAVCRWQWVRNDWFRVVHLTMILVVVAEAMVGFECPLTTWENDLKEAAGLESHEGGFIASWMHEVIFYHADPWVFTLAYILFGGLVLLTFCLVPPRRRKKSASKATPPPLENLEPVGPGRPNPKA